MDIRNFAERKAFPILTKGDPDWDKPHSEAAAFHIQQIADANPDLNLNYTVILLAAYLHDIGYSPFYKPGQALTKEEYMQAKREHMDRGVEIATELLADEDISESDKARILHLVSVHDRLDQLNDTDELVLMEADTLAGLDVNFVKPSFTKEENEEHMQQVRAKRLPLFITRYGKEKFEELISSRERYYQTNTQRP